MIENNHGWRKMNKPFIIAEVGINHSGDIAIAEKLIEMAYTNGCDAVKFQKRTVEEVYCKEYLDSPRESPWGKTQRDQKNGIEFGKEQYDHINTYCKKLGIPWFASAWDWKSQRFLRKYHLKYNKIASPMISNMDLLYAVAREHELTFISTVLALKGNIDNAVAIFKAAQCPFVLMHCANKYPCPDYELNLSRIRKLKEVYGVPVGYSHHNPGILPPSLAVAVGAEVIEVHITLDRTMYGSDQSASLEEAGLKYVVRDTHNVSKMLGEGMI